MAEEGVLFEHATTVVPLTLPAHSSIFTGTFPCRVTERARICDGGLRRRVRSGLALGAPSGLRPLLR
jgi:arylsulfatase A-like enzyme